MVQKSEFFELYSFGVSCQWKKQQKNYNFHSFFGKILYFPTPIFYTEFPSPPFSVADRGTGLRGLSPFGTIHDPFGDGGSTHGLEASPGPRRANATRTLANVQQLLDDHNVTFGASLVAECDSPGRQGAGGPAQQPSRSQPPVFFHPALKPHAKKMIP